MLLISEFYTKYLAGKRPVYSSVTLMKKNRTTLFQFNPDLLNKGVYIIPENLN